MNAFFIIAKNVSRYGEEVNVRRYKSSNMRASATGKARRPTVESLTAGTNRLSVVETEVFVESL